MKKRVLSMFMALALCLTLLPTAVFAEGEDVSISGGVIGGGETGGEGGGIYVAPGSPTEGGGGTYIPGEDTQTEIWCVSKPDSIGRGYDGTTDGGTIPIDLTFTDGTNEIELKEGTGFTAKKTFDSADAGWHTVTVEIALIGEAAVKYKLKAGEETFTIGGYINKAYPKLTVSLSKTACTAGEKLLPLLSVEGAPEGAAVTYYYTQYKPIAGSSEYEGSEAMPKIDENTAISEPGTYYVYAKSSETKNYDEERSDTVELTVNKAVVKAASVTKADGTDGGTYESLPAALNAAQDGDTVKLLANHTTNWSDVEASDLSTLAVVTKRLTLELNGWTVDYLEVGEVVPDEEGGILESTDGNLTIVDNIQDGSHGKIKDLQFVNGSLEIQSGQIGDSGEGKLTCNGNSGSVTVCGGTVLGLTVGEGASVTVSGGSTHAGFWFNDGTLTITGGTFGNVNFRNNGGTIAISGGTFSTIRNTGVSSNIPPMSLLAPGYAFYKDNAVQDGSKIDSLQDVTVKEHTHTMVDNKCACGFSCTHTNTKGVSTIGKDGKCTVCGTQVAAGIGETYYTDVKSALDAAADGQTVRLLANGMLPSGIYASKTLTLDLNGHSLSGYSLNVGGLTATSQIRTGNLTVIDSSGGNGAVGVTVRDGGTLVFDPENDSTTLLQLEVWGGTVELYGGRILRKGLQLNNSIVLGDLLPRKAGLAYYREGSDTQLTLKEAASKTCDLVVKSCAHGGKNGFDENATACPYCNAPAVAEAALNDGEGGRLRRRFTNLQTAIDADRDGGATLQLLADVTGDYTIDGTQDTGLNLNGHCIKGTVTVKAATGNNTTTFSNTQNNTTASIDAVVAHRGAKLAGTGYPAVIGKLTLADTTKWKDILQQPTRLGFRVTNADGTHKWYAPDDVNGSQLNNVIINSLPITTKTLNLKVDGKNLTGNSPKVERGTTVQLCAVCNAKGADVYIYIGEMVGNNNPTYTYSQKKAEYKKIGSSWYYVVDLYANTIGTYDIYFTASKDGYSVTSRHKKLTVIKAATPDSAITAPAANALTYNGKEQLLVTAGSVDAKYGEMQYRLGTSGGFSTAIPAATDAGTYTVYYKVVGAEGYNDTTAKSIKVTISPVKIKGIGNVASVSKTYDGSASVTLPKTNLAFLGAAGSMISIPGSVYRITDARFTMQQDGFIYEDSPDAGTKEAISFTLTLTDSNYAFEGKAANVRSVNFNFTSKDDRFKINQATVTPAEITLYVYNDVAKTYTLNLATLLPKLTPGCEYGKIKYQRCDYHFTDSTYLDSNNGMFVSNDGILTLPIVAAHSTDVNKQIGKITAPVVAANYQQFELTIKVVIGEKITPVKSDDFKISATGIIYRQTLENSRLTVEGTMKDPTTGEEVKGTFAWPDKYDIPSRTGDCYVDWIFTPAEGYEKYAAVTDIVKVHVAPKSIEGATITLEKYEFAYNAAEQSPKITGVTLENWYETRITYVIKSGDKATDANDSIPLTIEGTGNYTGKATVKWKITPKEVTPTIEVASCTYTGDALEPPVTVKDDTGNIIDPKEYEIFYSNNTNVGTATVTVKDVEGGNYVLREAGKTFEITKAAVPAAEAGSLTITNDLHKTYSLDLSTLLPKLTAPCDYGEIIYDKKVDTALGKGTYVTLVNGKTGELTLEANRRGTDEGQFGTITVTVSTSNYQDIILTINVIAKNRITPTGTPTLSKNAITYGDALNTIALSGKLHDNVNNVDVDGTFEWVDGTHIPVVGNGTYAAEWIFEPTDTEKYLTVSGRSNITVEKARQYGKLSMAGYTYGKTPSTPTLTDRTGDLNAQVTYRYAAADSGSVQTWDISNPPALNAGTYRMYASIGDTDNYYGFEAVYCEFVVAKATPTYTVPTGLTAKYGQTLADVTLPDGWSWMDSSESVGGASTAAKTFQAKFTPKDTKNYNTVENIELEVTVNKADGGNLKTVELEQKYTDASDHTYTPDWAGLPAGQDWTFSSEASIVLSKQDFAADGSLLTYAISGGKAGDKITITLKASCDNYEDFTITLNVTLTEKDDQKPLTITGAGSVVYGQTLTLTTTGGSGTGTVTYRIDTDASTGEATIDPETGVLTPVKVGSVSVIATKAGDNDYNDVTSAPFVLMIKPATPTGEPKYTAITTSGKTLKDAALTTKGSTLNPSDGKLEWVDDKGEPLPDDTTVKANTTYKWRFTPDDDNYTTLTGEVELYHKSSSGGGWYDSYYTIKATAGTGGSISPSGNVSVREGRDQTFTITPDKGYAVANVKIDGKSIGAVKSYTFENVSRTHTIEVIFMKSNGNPQTGVFVDVATGSYYEDAVDWAVENGITQGTDDTHFSPDGICTRAQAVTFLWRATGSPEPETRTMPFTDVPAGSYYYDAVLWAVENGITKGTSDTTFSPNATCTRAQIVAFLWRSEKSPAAGTANPFADVKSTAYYADAVLWAVREDITKGTTNTTFSPDADCTRAQIVTFLWRCKK